LHGEQVGEEAVGSKKKPLLHLVHVLTPVKHEVQCATEQESQVKAAVFLKNPVALHALTHDVDCKNLPATQDWHIVLLVHVAQKPTHLTHDVELAE